MFSLGCSYTNYSWPTVADIVGLSFDEHFNLGQPGGCNFFSMSKLIEIDNFYKLNSNTDFILIGITGVGRFSYVTKSEVNDSNAWITTGDILPLGVGHPENIKSFVKTLFNINHGIVSSYIALQYMKNFLESKNIKHCFYHALDNSVWLDVKRESNLTHQSEEMLKEILNFGNITESVEKFSKSLGYDTDVKWNDGTTDGHPSIHVYLEYVKKYFSKYFTYRTETICNEQINTFKISSKQDQAKHFMDTFVLRHRTKNEI